MTLTAPLQLQSQSQTPPTTFHLLPELPLEIRLKIWNMLSPRLVRFIPKGSLPPAVLSVCRELRNETRKQYSLETLGRSMLCPKASESAAVFIHYELHTLSLSNLPSERWQGSYTYLLAAEVMNRMGLKKVRRIMVPIYTGNMSFERWWKYLFWRRLGAVTGECKLVVFLFGGTLETTMEDLVDVTNMRGETQITRVEGLVNVQEMGIMSEIEKAIVGIFTDTFMIAREAGSCMEMEIVCVRDEERGLRAEKSSQS